MPSNAHPPNLPRFGNHTYKAEWKCRYIPTQTQDTSWDRGDGAGGEAGSVRLPWKGFLEKPDGGGPTHKLLLMQFSDLWGKEEFALRPLKKFCGLEVYL